MTDGHKHRHLHVSSFDTWWVRLLRRPVYAIHDPDLFPRVDTSPYPYREVKHFHGSHPQTCWELTSLSVLHRWTGLVLDDGPKRP